MKTNWEPESLRNSLDKKDGTFILQELDWQYEELGFSFFVNVYYLLLFGILLFFIAIYDYIGISTINNRLFIFLLETCTLLLFKRICKKIDLLQKKKILTALMDEKVTIAYCFI